MAERNLHAIHERIATAVADVAEKPHVSLKEFAARIRLLGTDTRQLADAEVRELLEMSLTRITLPSGAAGEASLAYSVAERCGRDALAVAVNVLHQHRANDERGRRAIADWLRESAHRKAVQAEVIEVELAGRAAL